MVLSVRRLASIASPGHPHNPITGTDIERGHRHTLVQTPSTKSSTKEPTRPDERTGLLANGAHTNPRIAARLYTVGVSASLGRTAERHPVDTPKWTAPQPIYAVEASPTLIGARIARAD